MATVEFGIVGCGMISYFHAKALAEIRGTRIRAVYDTVSASAERLAEELGGVDVHTDLDEMLGRSDLDVINICTPSGAHVEPAVKAARAGKHVVVEKPLEITLGRCDRIIEACKESGVQLCTILPSRFGQANSELKRAIDAGRFGRLTLGDTTVKWWRPQEYYDSGGWRGTWELDGGGSLMNQAIHNVDLLMYMMGPAHSIGAFTALLAHERIEVEDTAVAAIRFENGALGTIQATTSVYPGLLKTIGVHGDKGSVVIEQDQIMTWSFEEETDEDARIRSELGQSSASTGGASDPKAISHEGHACQLRDFLKAIQSGSQPLVDGAEGRKSVEIILGVYQSQATGQIVKLPLAKDPDPPKLS